MSDESRKHRNRMLKDLIKSFLAPHRHSARQNKYGCMMNSAREVTDMERRSIVQKMEALGPWFHNYEIASGVWTNPTGQGPGIEYPLSRWRLIEPLLPDVKGKSCLDVGCSSGLFSFKLKELGAAYVLGVDSGEQTKAIEQAQFAGATLHLDVDFRVLSAYDLATLDRKFDLILFMGVFYHLRHPLVALEAARAVCSGTMIFQTITTPHHKTFSELDRETTSNIHLHSSLFSDEQFPAMHFVEGTLDRDPTCWFIPNLQAVGAILRSCRFRPDHITFTGEHDVIVRCVTQD
jgi:tRNA (mo5U34)-methyltransferase